MRIYLKLSKNEAIVPYNYQINLVGALHKWLGENEEHGHLSMYSFSWLRGGASMKKGLNFPRGADWFISAYDQGFIKKAVKGIMEDPVIAFGMNVTGVEIVCPPAFNPIHRFMLASPVFIKRTIGERQKHYVFNEPEADALMTETLKNKMRVAGLNDDGLEIRFDRRYSAAKTTVCAYKNIKNRANYCPVIIQGNGEQLAFAWEVGVGNSTGIGFGALM